MNVPPTEPDLAFLRSVSAVLDCYAVMLTAERSPALYCVDCGDAIALGTQSLAKLVTAATVHSIEAHPGEQG